MTYYSLVTVTPTSEAWIPGYVESVSALIGQHGGRYLARTTSHQRIEGEGDDPALQVIIEWPSKEAADAFYGDPSYQPHLEARLSGSNSEYFLVEGKDDFS